MNLLSSACVCMCMDVVMCCVLCMSVCMSVSELCVYVLECLVSEYIRQRLTLGEESLVPSNWWVIPGKELEMLSA